MDQNVDPEKQAQATVQQVLPQQKKPGRLALQVFAVVVLLGLVGWGVYAMQNNRVAQLEKQVTELKKNPPADTKPTDEYAGWNTYNTKYEKLSFRYPSSLTLKDNSITNKEQGITPGTDMITLTSSSGLQLSINNGMDGIGGACPDCKYPRIDGITFFGSTNYLNYVDSGTGLIDYVRVAKEQNSFLSFYPSKNIKITETQKPTANLYSISFAKADGASTPKPLATFVNDPAMADFTKVLESFQY